MKDFDMKQIRNFSMFLKPSHVCGFTPQLNSNIFLHPVALVVALNTTNTPADPYFSSSILLLLAS